MADDPRLTPADGDREGTLPGDLDLLEMVGSRLEAAQVRDADGVAALVSDVVSPMLERLRARVAELEAAPVDWDAQRRRADELEATVERLRAELAEAKAEREAEESLVADLRDERDGLAAESRARLDAAAEDIRRARQQRDEQRQRADQAEAERDAAIARVQAMHVRNANSGVCEHCSDRDYPDYAVPWPCPTIAALDAPSAPESPQEDV